MLQKLAYELSVLTKAVEHKNLTAAAAHIGLSQPQLSRLIAKIEEELNVVLLDRSAKRKSGWTAFAHDLSLIFAKGMSRLEGEIFAMAQDHEQNELHIGTLEGLSGMASQFANNCFNELKLKKIYLDILDFNELESKFLSGSLDLIFSVRMPGKQKYEFLSEVGFQQMEKISTNNQIFVCSPHDLINNKKAEIEFPHLLISNSLSIREKWLKEKGGTGALPVDTRKGRGKGYYTIYLIGSDLLGKKLWVKIEELAAK